MGKHMGVIWTPYVQITFVVNVNWTLSKLHSHTSVQLTCNEVGY